MRFTTMSPLFALFAILPIAIPVAIAQEGRVPPNPAPPNAPLLPAPQKRSWISEAVKALLSDPNAEADLSSEHAVPDPRRDPTQLSPTLRQLMDPANQRPDQALPPIALQGRILGGLHPAMALVSIDKESILVRQGTEIRLTGSQSLRVVEVSDVQICLELMPSKRTISLH